MPASPHSLLLVESYRARLLATRGRVEGRARRWWPPIEDLDSTDWPERMAAALTQAQLEAVRVSAAYLGAFLTTEMGRRTRPPTIDAHSYAGKSRDGRPLAEALRSPLIGTLGALGKGDDPSQALSYGLNRARRMVSVDFDHTHRTALLEAIAADERFDGWQRSLAGTCGACAAVAGKTSHGVSFPVHPGCRCQASPVVRGAPNRYPVPTGAALFAAKSPAEQDEMLGPEAAELVRSGAIEISDLHDVSLLAEGEDYITQKPLSSLPTD